MNKSACKNCKFAKKNKYLLICEKENKTVPTWRFVQNIAIYKLLPP